ncbi:MAG: glutaredoxin family protein [Maribacter sp.]|nr:glutaredoxin family protein [Maribacter sp.]
MKLTLIILSLFIYSYLSASEIYKWKDENGKIHYTDAKNMPQSAKAEELELKINTYTSVSFDKVAQLSDKVIMYSASWCHFCKKARKYFLKNQIQFTEYDIEKNMMAKKRFKKMGASGVPVIIYKDKRMNGFSEAGFARIYK